MPIIRCCLHACCEWLSMSPTATALVLMDLSHDQVGSPTDPSNLFLVFNWSCTNRHTSAYIICKYYLGFSYIYILFSLLQMGDIHGNDHLTHSGLIEMSQDFSLSPHGKHPRTGRECMHVHTSRATWAQYGLLLSPLPRRNASVTRIVVHCPKSHSRTSFNSISRIKQR